MRTLKDATLAHIVSQKIQTGQSAGFSDLRAILSSERLDVEDGKKTSSLGINEQLQRLDYLQTIVDAVIRRRPLTAGQLYALWTYVDKNKNLWPLDDDNTSLFQDLETALREINPDETQNILPLPKFSDDLAQVYDSKLTNLADVMDALRQHLHPNAESVSAEDLEKIKKKILLNDLENIAKAQEKDIIQQAALFEKNLPETWREARKIAETARQELRRTKKPSVEIVNKHGENYAFTLHQLDFTTEYLYPYATQKIWYTSLIEDLEKLMKHEENIDERDKDLALIFCAQHRNLWKHITGEQASGKEETKSTIYFTIFDTLFEQIENMPTVNSY